MIPIAERNGEEVDRVMRVLGVDMELPPPDPDAPLETTPNGILVYFADGPREGEVSVMPPDCDYWVEPDGTIYA